MKTNTINLNIEKDGLVSLTQVFKLDKKKSIEIGKLVEERNKLGKELTSKLKDLGLVSASADEATVVER